MAEITAKMVNDLRVSTGAGLMDCKKALVEANGDVEKARDWLRVKGQASAEKRAARAAAEGAVAIAVTPEAVSLIEMNSETDFVARNDEFKALAHEIAAVAAQHKGEDVASLLEATLSDGSTVKQKVDAAVGKIGENLVVRRTVRYEQKTDNVLATYVHTVTNKIGVLVEITGDANNEAHKELAKNIAMHIAASKPKYVRREEVAAEEVERERTVLADKTREEGKPEAAIAKIVEGRIGKFYEGICLLDQPYVKEQSKKIGQLVSEAGSDVRRFALYQVGLD